MIPDWIGKLIGGGASGIIESVGGTAKKFITTEADRQAFDLALKAAELDARRLVMEAEGKYFADRASARDMYKHDSSLQKIFAITFLVGYISLTSLMLYLVVGWIGAKAVEIPDWAVALISTIYGAMSSKVNTITDFLFGSSQGSREKDITIQERDSR
jgi:hypothetical protein